jgi:predicted  nucleic acid-binding Zn-ribbon protein
MEDIETLRAELARVNKLRESLAKTIDEQADEIFRLKTEIEWYATGKRRPKSEGKSERTYGRGVDRLLYGS